MVFGSIDPELARGCRLPSLMVSHYDAATALRQKIDALAERASANAMTYAVSLARTRRFVTPVGTVSLHHVQPSFFFGFGEEGGAGGRLATPEKALVDYLYLTPARSGLFRLGAPLGK